MKCPYCGYADTRVTDSRESDDGIRRRRECLSPSCGRRFTTYERVQLAPLMVVKKDGRREEFSREKVLAGIRRSCDKLPISAAQIAAIVDDIESTLHAHGAPEVPSSEIGDLVMARLRELDHVAYVRFASHYKNFLSFEELQAEFERLSAAPRRGARSFQGRTAQPPLLPPTELSHISENKEQGARNKEQSPPGVVTSIADQRRRAAGGRR